MLKFSGGGYSSGGSRARPVNGDVSVPESADVVIVGGGVMGCCTALFLAERGVRVVLCEKGVIAGEASGRSAGMIDYEFRSPVKLEMTARSAQLWSGMSERVGRDIGYNDKGILTLFDDANALKGARDWLASVLGLPGVEARVISGAQAAQIDPAVGSSWAGALFQPNGASVEPKLAVPAIAEAARAAGAVIVQECAVRTVARRDGRVCGVETEKGAIQAGSVVMAGGIWSPMLARQLGLQIPQLMIFAEEISVDPLPDGPSVTGSTPCAYFRKEPDGGYMLGAPSGVVPVTPTVLKHRKKLAAVASEVEQDNIPVFNLRTFGLEGRAGKIPHRDVLSEFEKTRIFEPEILGRSLGGLIEKIGGYIPAFKQARMREHFSGSLMTTIDNLGVVSAIAAIPGLYVSTGMLYGMTLGPAAAEAIADMITGERCKFDLTPYRYERFEDGSEFKFHP